MHGFPSSSYDWKYSVAFFQNEGYGLIVPDLLGYGGTSKPADYMDYRASLMTKDVIEVLDKECAVNIVVVGHDWYGIPLASP